MASTLHKLLEHLESLELPEGEYLRTCNLLKQVFQNKDMPEVKVIPLEDTKIVLLNHWNVKTPVEYVFNKVILTPFKMGHSNWIYKTSVEVTRKQIATTTKVYPLNKLSPLIKMDCELGKTHHIHMSLEGSLYSIDYDEWRKQEQEEEIQRIEEWKEQQEAYGTQEPLETDYQSYNHIGLGAWVCQRMFNYLSSFEDD